MVLRLEVDGVGRVVSAMTVFNKEIYSELQSEVKGAAEGVASYARALTPDMVLGGGRSSGAERMSPGWGRWMARADGRDLGWNEVRVDRSIKASARQRRVRGSGVVGVVGRVVSSDPALSIYATAGSRTPSSLFNKNVQGKWGALPTLSGGRASRVLGQALIVKGPGAAEVIDQAIERAASKAGLR